MRKGKMRGNHEIWNQKTLGATWLVIWSSRHTSLGNEGIQYCPQTLSHL